MNAKQKEAVERIKEKNGGVLPSELYLMTNEELIKMVTDLTGKAPSARTSKTTLVQKIEKLTGSDTKKSSTKKGDSEEVTSSKKRKMSEKVDSDSDSEPIVETKKKQSKKKEIESKKPPRGCLPTLTSTQRAEMKRVLAHDEEEMEKNHTHKDLTSMWKRIGLTSRYPHMSPKSTVVTRLRGFAEKNLKYHDGA